jgi:hypothetical protein
MGATCIFWQFLDLFMWQVLAAMSRAYVADVQAATMLRYPATSTGLSAVRAAVRLDIE